MHVLKRCTYRERWRIMEVFVICHNINTVKGKITIEHISCSPERPLYTTNMAKTLCKREVEEHCLNSIKNIFRNLKMSFL